MKELTSKRWRVFCGVLVSYSFISTSLAFVLQYLPVVRFWWDELPITGLGHIYCNTLRRVAASMGMNPELVFYERWCCAAALLGMSLAVPGVVWLMGERALTRRR
jgi:hypothetical protein